MNNNKNIPIHSNLKNNQRDCVRGKKMVPSQCYGVIKYTLVFVNLIFWALGVTALILGLWMLMDKTFVVSLTQEQHNYHAGLYIMIAAGALLVLVSFLGCCGAFRESQCLLVSFFSLLLVVVVAQIAASAWLYTNRDRVEPLVKNVFTHTIKNEYGVIEYRTHTVDSIQSGLGCCGAMSPSDWAGSKYGGPHDRDGIQLAVSTGSNNVYRIPESCCKTKNNVECENIRETKVADRVHNEIYSEGCVEKLIDVLENQGSTILIGIVGLGLIELVGLMVSLLFCCAIGSSDRYKA